jgi:(4-alkanoyl-5-oxo-2,5-dihydrofuran-3-yl)methyl phosphate reductase
MNCLVTGATGEVGMRVTRLLLERGMRPRVLTRDANKAHALFGDRADIFVGDLALPATLRGALEQADVLFLVNVGPGIPERDRAAAELSREFGVRKIVKLSSLDVEEGLAIGAWHEKGEAALRGAGIPWVFVRPTGFMSNFLAWTPSIRAEGVVRSSTGDGRRPFIHPEDIAAVSAAALVDDGYRDCALAITGPDSLTFAEATNLIGQAIGRQLSYQAISDADAGERYSRVSGSPEETEAHVALWRAIREGRLAATTDGVERVLGRRPRSMRDWVSENAGAFRGGTGAGRDCDSA